MQPAIRIPDPAHPPFRAFNDAKTFDPFDRISLHWFPSDPPADREEMLSRFGLGLTYTPTAAASVYAPTAGRVSFRLLRDGDREVSRTLVLELPDAAVAA